MHQRALRKQITIALVWLLGFVFSGWAQADPPSRVARLAYVSGTSSFSPGGERDWVRSVVNRPLVTGDRLWVDAGARAELQLGAAAIRVGGATSITLLNLDDRVVQVQLTQGTLNIRVRRLDRGHIFEVDTPNLAYLIRRPGNYRIHVDADGAATTVIARSGLAEVYGEGRAFITRERQAYRFFGSGLRDYETFALPAPDAFDRFATDRDRRWDNSVSRRYVSPELIGYDDLDQYGTWRKVRDHGFVWMPTRVAADWAPYREGHWAWVEPWGWTWVDDAPWGFAPSHYGRWARFDGGWGWVPGPVAARPVYAPALVVFVGGSNLRISGSSGDNSAVGWFPLGPREVYRPSYAASREYFTTVNTSNTVIDRSRVTNVYNTTNVTNVTYVNQQVPGAVVAMLAAAFAQSRPVAKESVRVSREMAISAPATAVAQVAPVHTSIVGAAAPSSSKPPEAVRTRRVVAQAAPPPAPVPFALKQSALAANAGRPLNAAAVAALKPATPAAAHTVEVVAPAKPVALPAKPAGASAPAFGGPAAPAASAAQAPSATKPSMQKRSVPAASAVPAESPAAPGGRGRARGPAEAAGTSPPPASAAFPREARKPPAQEERARRPSIAAPGQSESAIRPGSRPAAPAIPASPAAVPPAAVPPAAVPPAAVPPVAVPPVAAPRIARPPVAAPPSAAPASRRVEAETKEQPPLRGPRTREAQRARDVPPAAAVERPLAIVPAPVAPVAPVAPPPAAARAASAAPPATPAVPATPAARTVPAAAPVSAPAAEPRVRRAPPDEARAPGRREAASEAKKADERRNRGEEERKRKP